MNKYSKQRELILQNLSQRCDHPTVEQLYESLRGEVSLPTVYRNVSMLCDAGKIKRIATEGAVRYDAAINEHAHFECIECAKVSDILVEGSYNGSVIDGHKIIKSELMLYGLCPHCQNKIS